MADEGQDTKGQEPQGTEGEKAAADAQAQASAGQPDASSAAAGQKTGAAQQTQTPGESSSSKATEDKPAASDAAGKQAEGGYRVSLTDAQRKHLLDDGVLEVSEDQYTSGVRQQMESLRRRATSAEKRLSEIAAAQEEAERKALEEQERYKELYEKERQGRETEATARREDLIRSRFLLSAQSRGIVDPDVAFVIAKGMPEFAGVKLDDEGNVAGIDAVIESLVTSKPYLVSQTQHKPQSVGAASNPAPQSPPPPKNLAEAGDRLEQALRTGAT